MAQLAKKLRSNFKMVLLVWAGIFLILVIVSILIYKLNLSQLSRDEKLPEPYTFDNIVFYSTLAKGAYETEEQNISEFGQQFRVVAKDLPIYQGRVLLLFDDANQIQYISSRGTANLTDILEDGEFEKTFDKKTGIYIHDGFLKSARETYEAILPEINEKYTTYVTGHSLGAAEATILHLFLYEDHYVVERTINFGQPKFTNKDGFNKYGKLPILRVVHGKDPVPLVPPVDIVSEIHGNYVHLGDELILLQDNYYSFLNHEEVSNYASSSFWGNALDRDVDLSDHYINNYIQSLETKLGRTRSVPFDQREEYLK